MIEGLSAFAIGCSVVRDVILLFRHSLPVGIDGYYYALQVRSLLLTGSLYYASRTTLVFHLAAGLARLGLGIIPSIKLISLTLELLLLIALGLLVVELTGRRQQAWLAVAIAALLPSHMFLLVDFIKESLCLTALLWAATFALKAWRTQSVLTYSAATVGVIIAIGSHVSAVLMLIAIGIFMVLIWKTQYDATVGVSAVIAAWCMGAITALPVFRQFVQPRVVIPVAKLDVTWWTPERLAILVAAPAALAMTLRMDWEARRITRLVFASIGLLALCLTVNPFLDQSSDHIFGRLSLTANLQVALLVTTLCFATKRTPDKLPFLFISSAFAFIAVLTPPAVLGVQEQYLNRRAQLAATLQQGNFPQFPKDAVVVAPHGDEFAVSFLLNVRAFHSWHPGINGSIYWLLDAAPADLVGIKNAQNRTDREATFAVVSDTDLRQAWGKLEPGDRFRVLRSNPELISGGYMPE